MDQINQVQLAIAAGRTTTIERLTRDATADFVENWKSAKMQQGRMWDFINTVAVYSGLEIIKQHDIQAGHSHRLFWSDRQTTFLWTINLNIM